MSNLGCAYIINILHKPCGLFMLVFLHLVFIPVDIIIEVMMKFEVYMFISAYCLLSL